MALGPPPQANVLRYHGVMAPRSKLRVQVVLDRRASPGLDDRGSVAPYGVVGLRREVIEHETKRGGSWDGEVIWSAASEDDELSNIALVEQSPDGSMIFVADDVPMGYRGTLARLVPADGSPGVPLGDRDDFRGAGCARFTGDGQRLLWATGGGVARWSMVALDGTSTWQGRTSHPERLREAADGARASILAEELATIDEVVVDGGLVLGAIDPTGSVVVGCCHSICDSALLDEERLHRMVYVWRLRGAPDERRLEAAAPVWALALDSVGRTLAVATMAGVELWDLETDRCTTRHPIEPRSRPD